MYSFVNPTWDRGFIENEEDALALISTCQKGSLPRVRRKLFYAEKHSIMSGSIFIWGERESGIKRWTDGRSWSASRGAGTGSSFFVYREMSTRGGGRSRTAGADEMRKSYRHDGERSEFHSFIKGLTGSLLNDGELDELFRRRNSGKMRPSDKFKRGGLIKKTFSFNMPDEKWHVVAYYSLEDALMGCLQTPRQFLLQGVTNVSESVADIFPCNELPFTYPQNATVDLTELLCIDSDNLCLTY